MSEVHELLLKVHDILDKAVSNMMETVLIFQYTYLILLPGSIMRSGIHRSPFFMVLLIWFLLVRLACVAI